MGSLYAPAPAGSAYVSLAPVVTVEINGQVVGRDYVTVESLHLSSGIAPSPARLIFPTLERGADPLRPFDRVRIWLDRHRDRTPRFVGRVQESPSSSFDTASGSIVSYTAVDLRHHLSDAFCSRDYNTANDQDGRRRERLGSRDIASAILREYQAHQETVSERLPDEILGWNLASFPDQQVGEFLCKGETHAEALQRLVSLLGDGSYRLGMNYLASGGAQLFAFPLGRGAAQAIVIGTDPAAGEFAQPYGVASVGSGSDSRDLTKTVNVIVMESPKGEIFETAVRLRPNFDTSQSNLSAPDKYLALIQPNGTTANGLYDPGAVKIGRSYIIPEIVDLDGVRRRLAIAPELCQARFPGDGNRAFRDEPQGPRVAWKWREGDPYEYMVDGFRIESNGEVTLRIALLKEQTTDSETEDVPLVAVTLNKRHVVQDSYSGGFNGLLQYGVKHLFVTNGQESPLPFGVDLASYVSGTLAIRLSPEGGEPVFVRSGNPNATVASGFFVNYDPVTAQARPSVFIDAGLRQVWLYVGTVPFDWVDTEEEDADKALSWISLAQRGATFSLFFEIPAAPATMEAPILAPPEFVYLNAAFVSQVPLRVESERQGGAKTEVRRLTSSSDGKRERGFHFLRFTKATDTPGFFPATVTEEAWEAEAPTDEDAVVFRDDSYGMRQTATNMAKRQAEGISVATRTLPRMPQGFRIGASVVENGKLLGKSIVGVTYTLGNDPTTTIEAASL